MLDSHTTGGVLRPSSLKAISDDIRSSGAQVIFKPSWEPNKTLKRISKRSGVTISAVSLYGEGVADGETAVSTTIHNICTMVKVRAVNVMKPLVNSWLSVGQLFDDHSLSLS